MVRLPIPIKISASNLSEQVAKARDATFYYIPTGTTSYEARSKEILFKFVVRSIRVGISNQKQEEVVANTLTVSRALASFLPQVCTFSPQFIVNFLFIITGLELDSFAPHEDGGLNLAPALLEDSRRKTHESEEDRQRSEHSC